MTFILAMISLLAHLILFGIVLVISVSFLGAVLWEWNHRKRARRAPALLNPIFTTDGGIFMQLPDVVVPDPIHVGDSFSITLAPTDNKGKPDALASPATFTPNDGTLVSGSASADGLTYSGQALAPGNVVVAIHGEGDPTAGVDALDQNVKFTVLAVEAVALNPTFTPNPAPAA